VKRGKGKEKKRKLKLHDTLFSSYKDFLRAEDGEELVGQISV
jgi:hypothetical protein